MPSIVTLKARGLVRSPNQLELPEGSLTEASNVIIRRDNVIEPRRGFKLYGTEFGTSTDRVKQLLEYKNRLIRHYQTTLQFDTNVLNPDGESVFQSFSGSYSETETGLRIKSAVSNGNFYFTTSDGVKKLSAASANDLSTSAGYITNAGGIKAVDLQGRVNYVSGNTTGFLPGDAAVAYRVVWGVKDANNNLIIGTPSQRAEIYNPLTNLIVLGLNDVLAALDKASDNSSTPLIGDGDYLDTIGQSISAGASELKVAVNALAQKLDEDILIADNGGPAPIDLAGGNYQVTNNVAQISKGAGGNFDTYLAIGDFVYIVGVDVRIDGLRQLTNVTTTVIEFSIDTDNITSTANPATAEVEFGGFRNITEDTNVIPDISSPATNDQVTAINTALSEILTLLKSISNTNIISSNNKTEYIDPIVLTTTTTAILDITVPEEITTSNFYQLYRSNIKKAEGVTAFEDIVPDDEMKLVYEAYPTQAEIDAGIITIEDITPDLPGFVGANLYTNEATGEGILQANDIPPFCKDLTVYKGYGLFSNTRTRHKQTFQLLGVQTLLKDYQNGIIPKLTIATEDYSNTYSFIKGVKQIVEITFDAGATGTGLNGDSVDLYTAYDKEIYYVFFNTGIASSSGASTTITVTTNDNHGLSNGDTVNLSGTNSSPSIDGEYEISNITAATFDITVPAALTSHTTIGKWHKVVEDKKVIRVDLDSADTTATIFTKTKDAFALVVNQFTTSGTSPTLYVENIDLGSASAPTPSSISGQITSASIDTAGVGEKATQNVSQLTCTAVVTGGQRFNIFDAFDKPYYIWYTVDGLGSDPLPSGRQGIQIDLLSTDTPTQVASKIAAELNLGSVFTASNVGAVLTITNVNYGPCSATADVDTPFTSFTTVVAGELSVLLSDNVSPSIAIDETTRSLIRIINKNKSEQVYGYYTSTASSVPGKFYLEARSLGTKQFYLLGNNSITGTAFSPDLTPALDGTSVNTFTNNNSSPTTITTVANHGLEVGDIVVISNSDSVPSLDGVYEVAAVPTSTTFQIAVNSQAGAGGTTGSFLKTTEATASENDEKINRIYYSKFQQFEAVPIVNYIDIGASDKAILRIVPLRDSVFVFKEDGLYRLSGETSPFTVALFDSSCILIAPDSIGIANNAVYGWTRQGIQSVTEAGADIVSRAIDTDILKLASSDYVNFKTATWATGYDSDNSYIVWTIKNPSDTSANIAYRYSNLTGSWTTIDKQNTCGIINPSDDKLYLGAGDTNFIEQERKSFNRYDYADREIETELLVNNYFGDIVKLPSVTGITAGDVVVQTQKITPYIFNMLLKKLDIDSGVGFVSISSITQITSTQLRITATNHNLATGDFVKIAGNISVPSFNGTYQVTVISSSQFDINISLPVATLSTSTGTAKLSYYDTLSAAGGSNLRTKLVNLTNKLDTDPLVNDTDYTANITVSGLPISFSSSTKANPCVVTTAVPHQLVNNRKVSISSHTNSEINGEHIVTVISPTTFSIPISTTVTGTGGSFVTLDNDFDDIKACYNATILKLNNDTGLALSNYTQVINDTIQEAVIIKVDKDHSEITLNYAPDLVIGPMIIFQSIETNVVYGPATMGDPLMYKHVSEATTMFENKAFTFATMGFATDLFPKFTDITFNGDGSGVFGQPSFGNNFFGGGSNSAPFRTYVPREAQRCRYLLVRFKHNVAREKFSLYGVTLSGRVNISTRAYR